MISFFAMPIDVEFLIESGALFQILVASTVKVYNVLGSFSLLFVTLEIDLKVMLCLVSQLKQRKNKNVLHQI